MQILKTNTLSFVRKFFSLLQNIMMCTELINICDNYNVAIANNLSCQNQKIRLHSATYTHVGRIGIQFVRFCHSWVIMNHILVCIRKMTVYQYYAFYFSVYFIRCDVRE